jgi:hypothetical protein
VPLVDLSRLLSFRGGRKEQRMPRVQKASDTRDSKNIGYEMFIGALGPVNPQTDTLDIVQGGSEPAVLVMEILESCKSAAGSRC